MRSRDLSGRVPRLLSPFFISSLEILLSFFHHEKLLALAVFLSLFFFPPSATSVLRQSAANDQHILTGIIALCALLPASRWKPILEWIRQIHTCFLSPRPHPATQVQFGLLRHNCESVCPFFFLLLFFYFSAQNGRFASVDLAKADQKKGHKSLFYFCWKVEKPHKRLHVVRPEELNSRPEPCAAGQRGMEQDGQRAIRY